MRTAQTYCRGRPSLGRPVRKGGPHSSPKAARLYKGQVEAPSVAEYHLDATGLPGSREADHRHVQLEISVTSHEHLTGMRLDQGYADCAAASAA